MCQFTTNIPTEEKALNLNFGFLGSINPRKLLLALLLRSKYFDSTDSRHMTVRQMIAYIETTHRQM